MATTMASLVRDIRNLVEDRPASTQLNGAISSATATTMTVDDAKLVRAGVVYEFDDGGATGAELVLSDSAGTVTPTIRRGWEGSTAVASHADNLVIWVDPLYRYNKIMLAINKVLNTDLLPHLYEIVEHEVTSSTTANSTYVSPAAACEFILNIYQNTSSVHNTPDYLDHFEQYRNVDTDLYATGKYFRVFGGTVDGTTVFYVNCAHPLGATTLGDGQADAVRYLAAAHLLEWGEPRTAANQNERRVQVGQRAGLARYFREEGKAMLKREAAKLRHLAPPRREWFRRR